MSLIMMRIVMLILLLILMLLFNFTSVDDVNHLILSVKESNRWWRITLHIKIIDYLIKYVENISKQQKIPVL